MENKRIQVHMLPTEDETLILVNTYINNTHNRSNILSNTETLDLHSNNTDRQLEERGYKHQHLYFTDDSPIKESDWCISGNEVFKSNTDEHKGLFRKIIATTDIMLRNKETKAKRYPKPSQTFIKKYCELGGIEYVLVEYEEY